MEETARKDAEEVDPDASQMETEHGILYKPRSGAITFPTLIGAFFGGPLVAKLIGLALGGLSENAQIFLYLMFTVVFFGGYSLWMARLQALAFELVGKSVLKALFVLLVRRKKPKSMEELIPSREKLIKMAVRAQQAASAFWIVSIPVSMATGVGSLVMESDAGTVSRVFATGAGCVVWGIVLATLARRGYLPILEE